MALSKHTKRRNTTTQTATATSRSALSTTNRRLDSSSLPSPLSPSPPSSRVALVPLRINLRRLPSRQFSSQSSQILTPVTSHHPSPPSSPGEDTAMFTSKTFVKAGTKRKRSASGAENATSTTGRVVSQRTTRGTVPRGRFKRQKSESILGSSGSDEDLDERLSVATNTTDTNSGEEDEEVDLVDTDGDGDNEEDNEDAETVGSAMEVDMDEVDSQDGWEGADSENDSGAGDSSNEYYLNEASIKELLRLRKDALVRLYTSAGLSDDSDALTKHDLAEAIISARNDILDLPPSSPSGCTSSDGSSDDGHFGGGEETDVSHRFRSAATNGLRRRVTVHNIVAQPTRNKAGRTISLGQLDKEQFDTSLNTAIAKYSNLGVRSKSSTARSSPSASHASSSLPSPPVTRQRTRKVSATQSLKNGKGKQVDFGQVEIVDATGGDDSDLTDLTELDEQTQASPSPRRLRSKGDKTQRKSGIDSSRKASFAQKLKARASELTHQGEDEELPDASDEDEDQLMSTPSKAGPLRSAARGRRTPVKSRLRPRPTQTHTPPSDGDDEEEEEEESVKDDGEEGNTEEDRADLSDDDTEATPVEPRTLRNGKVVSPSEESVEMEAGDEEIPVDEDETANDETASVQSESTSDVEGEEDSDIEGEIGEESMDEFDLSTANVKSLTRLRRDDLVRLCEARDLDASGKKAQLVRALIKWRDHPIPESSCPSSTGTVRPHTRSSRSRGSKGSKGKLETYVHPPQTPPVSNSRDTDPDVDLDLSSLGLHDREIPPDKITKLSKIGSGGFKDVFVGKLKARKVAIAEFRGQLSAMDIKELKLLGDFSHPNIVRFMGVSIPLNTRETPVMIISELCSNGDLFDYLRGSPVPAVRRMVCMMLDIARGIQYLHNHKPSVIHRDCKSSNILITSKGVAKITDFGLAKVKQSTRSMVRSLVGTVNWQAPELWHPQPKYNFKVDVFSCAMVYWEMFQWHLPDPKYPWEGMNEHAIYDIVGAKRQRPSTEGLKRQWRPELVDLMERMWVHDPTERPAMDEIVAELEEIFNRL
ncbi:hypothetical protein BDM02DRAFT_3267146 [Thelephora ganbajun]|uniref:Uncharacterized protein n=1 Tax=Thelephora ganbajun TaxID=370292 RepID=A0ACB6ZPN0_THEGA|nr:hypothetical protein BDM02DRAFT_3267146 [Thelephora ganbajun]